MQKMADFESESCSSSCSDSNDDEADYGKTLQMLGSKQSSWSYIVQSIKNFQKNGQVIDFATVFLAARQALLCEDFPNAIKLFALALDQSKTETESNKLALSLSLSTNPHTFGSKSRSRPVLQSSLKVQLLELQNLVRTAISSCAFTSPLHTSSTGNQIKKDEDLKQSISSIISNFTDIGLGDATLFSQASAYFLRYGDYDLALDLSERAVALDPLSIFAQEVHENICCHLVERWHFIMLNDSCRNESYKKAIIKGIDLFAGNVNVCDIGCGTGLLSLVASNQPKCRSVYAIEKMKTMAGVAKKVFVENLREEDARKIELINKMSSKMSIPTDLPHHAQILVTEVFDAGLFGEGILPTLCHAWSKLLNHKEREMRSLVIPSSAKLFVQAIESAAILHESRLTPEADFFSLSHSNLCICSTVGMYPSDPYTTHDLKRLPGGYKALSESCLFMEVDFNNPETLFELEKGMARNFPVTVTKAGQLDALAMWFSLCLLDTEEISTHTDSHGCWEQAIFPVNPRTLKHRSSLNVDIGDILEVSQLVKGAEHCLSVTDIYKTSCDGTEVLNPGATDKSTECQPLLLKESALEWCKSQTYCLSGSEIAALNNSELSQALCRQINNFILQDTGCVESHFIHLNNGFSPLCLQALKLGYMHVWAIENNVVHKVLMWKLAQENGIDISNLTLLQDAAEISVDIQARGDCSRPHSNCSASPIKETTVDFSGNVVDSSHDIDEGEHDSTDFRETQNQMSVVVLDVVDWQGRLLEDLNEKILAMRSCLSTYGKVSVVPHLIDVYGVLIESEELLSRSRVVSDEQTLGYKIASFVNKFSTRNHQAIDLQSLPHTKLCEPFKIFSVDLHKLLLGSESTEIEERRTTERQGSSNTSKKSSPEDTQYVHGSIWQSSQLSSTINSTDDDERIGVLAQTSSQANTTKGLTSDADGCKNDSERIQESISLGSKRCSPAEKDLKEDNVEDQHERKDGFEQSVNIRVRITSSGTITALVYWFHFHLDGNKVTLNAPSVNSQIPANIPDALFPASNDIDINGSTLSSNLFNSQLACETDAFLQTHTQLSERSIIDDSSHMTDFEKAESCDIPLAAASSMSNNASASVTSETTISTLDPSQHWQQAAVMTDPAKEQETVVPGDHLHLQCVMGSSALSFWIKD
ncbi:protein arginine methyltransferase 10 (Putative) [Elysia marginata]|uniref:Protein arginine methyltransferase 10 (Putative) n=1 Tax=Elysia marginata TaxID=1093978 RepID=A0AAV4F098_9GAST|nr:protein arginine methyltransferase 10 (Putative) [Elysia marginata]